MTHFSPGIGVIDPRRISGMSVRASGYFYISINISLSIHTIGLKFWTYLEKAIDHMKLQQSKPNYDTLCRQDDQCGSKRFFFQFFNNSSKTKKTAFLIFWYVIELIEWHVFFPYTKTLKYTLHRHFRGQTWQKWHIHYIRSPIAVGNHAHKWL